MLKLTSFPEIQQLNREEKLELIELLKSDVGLTENIVAEPMPEWHKAELDERLKDIEDGKTTFSDWEDIKKKYPVFVA